MFRTCVSHFKEQTYTVCSFLFVLLIICAGVYLAGCAGGVPSGGTAHGDLLAEPDSLTSIARTAVASGDLTRAKSLYDAALEAEPDHAGALRGLAELAVTVGDPVSAVSYYDRLSMTDSSTPEDQVGLAKALTSAGRPDDAVAQLGAAARQYPDAAQLQAELGLLLLELGRMDDALPYLYRAVELNGASTKAAHMALGQALFDEKRYSEAAEVLDSYNLRYPGYFDVNMQLGFIYFQNGSFKKALPCYRAAVDAKPNSVDARVGLAKTLEQLDRIDSAIRAYDRAIEIRGVSRELEPVILAQANLLNKSGKYGRTLDLVARAGAVFPETAGLACARGMALAGEGRYGEAVAAFRTATGDPRWSEFANAQIRRIQKLGSDR